MTRSVGVTGSWALTALIAMGACEATPEEREPAVESAAGSGDGAVVLDASLPRIHDHAASSPERVAALVRAALDGLGFDPSRGDGPQPADRVFVGRHYLAWIDETGFAGKMNGLWILNGAEGDALDFVTRDPDGRPVNVFVPGEDGEGRWPSSYKGAEHVEFPSRVVEPGDSCSGDWCNQYAHDEAPRFTNPRIPWWTACNTGARDWASHSAPVVVEALPDGIKLVYEERLVKEADGDGRTDGDACHADYMFPDRVRRPVYLRLGYELHGDAEHFDRTMQLRNPAGNPQLAGDMSLIGGFVMTAWPNPHYLKRLHRFWRPEVRDVQMSWGGTPLVLRGGAWNDLSSYAPVGSDVLIAWIDQPVTLSSVAGTGGGQSATLAHVGPIDNQDVGACLCTVHGAIEMGGGLIHAGISLPIGGGQSTNEARRRLTVSGQGSVPAVRALVYEAETGLSHGLGRADRDGWSAATLPDRAGHMAYGPYATDWGGGAAQAVFYLMVDNNTANDDLVVTLDVYDATAGQVLATREVRRRSLRQPFAYQRFALNADLDGRSGHRMETRVYWHDKSYVRLDKVVVNVAAP